MRQVWGVFLRLKMLNLQEMLLSGSWKVLKAPDAEHYKIHSMMAYRRRLGYLYVTSTQTC